MGAALEMTKDKKKKKKEVGIFTNSHSTIKIRSPYVFETFLSFLLYSNYILGRLYDIRIVPTIQETVGNILSGL